MTKYLGIKEIWQVDERTLGISWTDKNETHFDIVKLRQLCPCAVCVDEMSGTRKSSPSPSSETVRPTLIKSVGRYALTIQFNDGHNTGIYTYEYLKRLSSTSP